MYNQSQEELKKNILSNIRTVKDWPIPGIQFRDITPLLHNAALFQSLINAFTLRYRSLQITQIVGIEARGFILGSALALSLGVGFVPIRKKGKLPFAKLTEEYLLEYGEASMEIHTDACSANDRVVLIDDLIATGGSILAGIKLLKRLNTKIVEAAAIIELNDLDGVNKLKKAKIPTFTLCSLTSR